MPERDPMRPEACALRTVAYLLGAVSRNRREGCQDPTLVRLPGGVRGAAEAIHGSHMLRLPAEALDTAEARTSDVLVAGTGSLWTWGVEGADLVVCVSSQIAPGPSL